ncbi:helix-turn-helix domain-containing protein [Chryseolinea sp. H1M3-3]|uniref:helix-turn-helix domain-containing protein n=1 Tax=Chryseolinea sp. H1M3-3 TaxID=3034144 RepID=UPI0023EABD18|nr:helix-turn-helix domain-containing protein [Chryseolinea sp. H1M3-3]
MEKAETLQEFYKRKFAEVPGTFTSEIGHFNIFRLEPFVEGKPTNIPYRRRDFFKIMLVKGQSDVHFTDKTIAIKTQGLSFSSPQIPYKWEHLDKIREGVYCIFDQQLFHQFGQLTQYEVFQPNGKHIFELTDEQVSNVNNIFRRIEKEFNSEYKYKYDVIRNLISELIHFGLRLQPPVVQEKEAANASQRISALFLELLERQFPVDDQHPAIQIKSASEFADQLNIHVNHLNRAIKETLQKTTTQVIAERVVQEAKILLRHSKWGVAEIGYALGFTEPTHFNNFFKKHTTTSPTKFRNV